MKEIFLNRHQSLIPPHPTPSFCGRNIRTLHTRDKLFCCVIHQRFFFQMDFPQNSFKCHSSNVAKLSMKKNIFIMESISVPVASSHSSRKRCHGDPEITICFAFESFSCARKAHIFKYSHSRHVFFYFFKLIFHFYSTAFIHIVRHVQ